MIGSESALVIEGLTKSFLGNEVLSDVSIRVQEGEIHVLVGQNGSGKSTLIKLLSGFHNPDRVREVRVGEETLQLGVAEHAYRSGLRFVHQDLGLVDTSTIADNLRYGVGYPTRWGTILGRRSIESAKVDLARIDLYLNPRTKVGELGAAERTGVAIARALREDPKYPPKLLVLDEPTATLPVDEVENLLSTLRQAAARGIGILYVTHHLEEVFAIADSVTVLRDGKVVASLPITALSREKLVRLLVGEAIEPIHRVGSAAALDAQSVLEVEGLSSGSASDVTFSVKPGEVVGLGGLTGSGRESVLGAIFGATTRDGGVVIVDGLPLPAGRPDVAIRRGVAYLSADRKGKGGIMTMSARENLTLPGLRVFWKLLRLRHGAEKEESKSWFERLDVRPANGSENLLATFSGGNQQKILVAKWRRQQPTLFLIDEPTQGVDVGAKVELHREFLQLAEVGTAIVISSTDVDELVTICDRVLIIQNGSVLTELRGEGLTHAKVTSNFMSNSES